MKFNTARCVVAGSLALLGLSANAWAQDVVKIAVGAPLTGPLAKMGQEVANAVKLAADEWNAKGGVKQLPDVGLDVRLIGGDSLFEPKDFIEASGGAAEGSYVSFLAPDMRKVPAAAKFVKAFEAKYGPLSSYGPLAYEAANILLEGVKKVGKTDRAAIRDAVRATRNYQGILGAPITFDDKGDVTSGLIFMYQVKGAAFEQVKTIVVK